MRTADLTSRPKALTWLVYCRENKLLTASEWALAALVVTLGKGQNITLSVTGMADILGMRRNTVSKAIDGLVAKGLMVPKAKGRSNKTFYRLTLPKATAQMRTSHCSNQDQSLLKSGPVDCSNEDHNIEERDEDRQEDEHQHPDDDVVTSSSSSSTPSGDTRDRAKRSSSASRSAQAGKASSAGSGARPDKVPGDSVPADSGVPAVPPDDEDDDDAPTVEEVISDLEGVVDELARRLGMDPGKINIKVLAKKYRDICIRYNYVVDMQNLLDAWDQSPVWDRLAVKASPIGYFLNELERRYYIAVSSETDSVPA